MKWLAGVRIKEYSEKGKRKMGHRTSHSCFSPFARSPNAICFLFNVMVLEERPCARCIAGLQLWTRDVKHLERNIYVHFPSAEEYLHSLRSLRSVKRDTLFFTSKQCAPLPKFHSFSNLFIFLNKIHCKKKNQVNIEWRLELILYCIPT